MSHLRDDITGNRFHEGMPSYLLVPAKAKRDLENEEDEDRKHSNKKLKDLNNKDKFKDLGEMVKNTQAV
ncbi:MAG: hypothetical protein ACK53Y_06075, partial [bacterium]